MSAAVEWKQIAVWFGDTLALDGVSLTVGGGEVHAVVGENGAGKSTLMRTLYGLVPAAAGEVWVKGRRIERPSPAAALAAGVGMVHQHFMLIDPLTVAENVVLGREPQRWGLLDRRRAEAEVGALAEKHRLGIDPRRVAGELSVGERQRVEILKVLYRGAVVLVLDEPTAVLTPPEVGELFAVLGALRAAGSTVILVTHKLDEVMAISEQITVLRRGKVVAQLATRETTPDAIVRHMVGRDLAGPPPRGSRAPGAPVLELERITVENLLHDVSLTVRSGEIVGIAGVEGNGQRELALAVAGLVPIASGRVAIEQHDVTRATPARRRDLGLGQIPEDRHLRGLVLDWSIADNLLLGREAVYARPGRPGLPGLIDRARLLADAARLLAHYDVRPADPESPVRALSGGNQQKVILARELERRPKILIAAQPTRGVDVGAVERIHAELDGVRRSGGGVLLISAELDELLALADRILVLYRGRIVGELDRAAASRAALGPMMMGVAATGGRELRQA